jgi:hypothetical protein
LGDGKPVEVAYHQNSIHLLDPVRFESVDDNEKWGCRLRFTMLRQPFSNINIAFSWKNVAMSGAIVIGGRKGFQ